MNQSCLFEKTTAIAVICFAFFLQGIPLEDCHAQGKSIKYGATIELCNAKHTKRLLGTPYGGKSYYYPIMRESGDKLKISTAEGKEGVVRYGHKVQLKTTSKTTWTSSWQSYDILGAFADGVYYWKDYGEKSDWIIRSEVFDGDTDPKTNDIVKPKDTVILENRSYKRQYLYGNSLEKSLSTDGLRDDGKWVIRLK